MAAVAGEGTVEDDADRLAPALKIVSKSSSKYGRSSFDGEWTAQACVMVEALFAHVQLQSSPLAQPYIEFRCPTRSRNSSGNETRKKNQGSLEVLKRRDRGEYQKCL